VNPSPPHQRVMTLKEFAERLGIAAPRVAHQLFV
jgi:hypothetical protein